MLVYHITSPLEGSCKLFQLKEFQTLSSFRSVFVFLCFEGEFVFLCFEGEFDIIIVIKDESRLLTVKETLEKSSVLKFTYELGMDKKIKFLHNDVENNCGAFVTSIYTYRQRALS